MAFKFDGGVILAADSRTSSGSYVANRVSDKVTKLSDKIYVCRSGSAADTQAMADYATMYLNMQSIDMGESPRVSTAASLLQALCYSNRNYLMAGLICAGYDDTDGPSVYNIPLGGAKIKQPCVIGGSGSAFISGWVSTNYKEGMSKQESVEFAVFAISLAISLDSSSGGVARVTIITEDGVERKTFSGDELPCH
eukprot:CAMPEP_0113890768 /NCGR_PEP_ID=MMETSP0780_2-20120614/14344_1 /TAXON_ID=652834 /ORGANISM="Palpitomonas bilix" /LENGTH=194 /DNA_ID=CAMNT_0000880231 /DNA_START=250 /DNA_END=834 /DNA_ORIENTATION=+ /assembly_acc=CAM_ASM_000599